MCDAVSARERWNDDDGERALDCAERVMMTMSRRRTLLKWNDMEEVILR